MPMIVWIYIQGILLTESRLFTLMYMFMPYSNIFNKFSRTIANTHVNYTKYFKQKQRKSKNNQIKSRLAAICLTLTHTIIKVHLLHVHFQIWKPSFWYSVEWIHYCQVVPLTTKHTLFITLIKNKCNHHYKVHKQFPKSVKQKTPKS